MAEEKKKLSILGIQNDLKEGLDRKAIAEKYGLKQSQVAELFQHPKLKGLKVKKPLLEGIELIDDAPEKKVAAKKAKAEAETDTEVVSEASSNGSAAPVEAAKPKEEAPAEVKQEKGLW